MSPPFPRENLLSSKPQPEKMPTEDWEEKVIAAAKAAILVDPHYVRLMVEASDRRRKANDRLKIVKE